MVTLFHGILHVQYNSTVLVFSTLLPSGTLRALLVGNSVNLLFTRHVLRCVLIRGPSKWQSSGSTLKANAVAVATANRPQSLQFGCACMFITANSRVLAAHLAKLQTTSCSLRPPSIKMMASCCHICTPYFQLLSQCLTRLSSDYWKNGRSIGISWKRFLHG